VLTQACQQLILLQRPVLLQLAFADQGEQRLQQRVLRLAIKQRADYAADDGKLIHYFQSVQR